LAVTVTVGRVCCAAAQPQKAEMAAPIALRTMGFFMT